MLNVCRYATEKTTVLQLTVRSQSERLIHNSERGKQQSRQSQAGCGLQGHSVDSTVRSLYHCLLSLCSDIPYARHTYVCKTPSLACYCHHITLVVNRK